MSSNNTGQKQHSKKWVSKLSRSLSTSSMPRDRQSSSGAATSPRPSPPRITSCSPRDGVDLPPPSPTLPYAASASSATGGTTPKKSWERHYRSFLRGRIFFDRLSPPDLEKLNLDDPSKKSPRSKKLLNNNFNDKSPSSRKLLFGGGSKKQKPTSPKNIQQPDLEEMDTSAAVQQQPMPLPDLSSCSRTKSKSLPLPDLSSSSRTRSKATLLHQKDAAVRGGSLFTSVFKRDRSLSNYSNPSFSSSDEDPSMRRKQKSTTSDDDLDAAVRKGHSVTYSRDNVRFQKKTAIDDDTEKQLLLKPRHVSGRNDDLEGSVRGGVARRHTAGPLPQSLITTRKQGSANHRSKEMKVAFTEFHNSAVFAKDSTSAYLGDEPSQHRNDAFSALYNQRNNAFATTSETQIATSRFSEGNISLALSPVTEGVVPLKKTRILIQPLGTETWSTGRRYLIAPAAWAKCPKQVLPMLSGHMQYGEYQNHFNQQQEQQQQHYDMSSSSSSSISPPVLLFGSLVLGTATVTYVGRSKKGEPPYNWSSCVFVLRQNYLLEYCEEENSIHELPRGFAHLQHSTCQAHDDFHDALRLQFYASPCAKVDQRTLMIRVKSRQERDWWVTCLTAAAQLTIESLYEFDEAIKFGDGRYASVFPARKVGSATTNAPHDCALKVIEKREFWHRVQKGRERADTLVREVAVQATLSAKCGRLPTFLQIRGLFETCDHVVMELELLEGTDLFQHVSTNGVLDEDEAAHITRDLLTSLDAMRRIGVAHRDVKPANILMCHREKEGVAIKIGDYGMSTFVGDDGLVRGRCGTPGYVAPEIFGAGAAGGYGNKVDVFSAGVTLYVMLCGYEPFYGESDAELIAANREADVEFARSDWGKVSPEAIDLVKRMLESDPKKRIGAREALQHPWIVNRVPPAPWFEMSEFLDRLALTPDEVSTDAACTIC